MRQRSLTAVLPHPSNRRWAIPARGAFNLGRPVFDLNDTGFGVTNQAIEFSFGAEAFTFRCVVDFADSGNNQDIFGAQASNNFNTRLNTGATPVLQLAGTNLVYSGLGGGTFGIPQLLEWTCAGSGGTGAVDVICTRTLLNGQPQSETLQAPSTLANTTALADWGDNCLGWIANLSMSVNGVPIINYPADEGSGLTLADSVQGADIDLPPGIGDWITP